MPAGVIIYLKHVILVKRLNIWYNVSTLGTLAFLPVNFNLKLINLRLQVLCFPGRLDTQYPVMWERHLHQQWIYTHWQDVSAGKLSAHKAVLVHSLSVPSSHFQQIVYSSHAYLIWRELAYIQQYSIPVVFTFDLGETSLQLFVDAGTDIVSMIQDRGQQVLGSQCWVRK